MLFFLFLGAIVGAVYWWNPCLVRHNWGPWSDATGQTNIFNRNQHRTCKRCNLRGFPWQF